ncbi:hypothetical protein AAM22_gp22 [Pantoea phage vB_PagM_AAM22]|nr:hypothetical protein AAM22_gp22 [Pantoea phage vB_PagM_AAM22]
MNYAEMSDYQINNLVHNQLLEKPFLVQFNRDGSINWIKNTNVIVTTVDIKYTKNGLHDYCNSWADAGPIIEKNRISIEFDGDDTAQWCHTISCEGLYGIEYQSNPLRAAMIVFLMMQECK